MLDEQSYNEGRAAFGAGVPLRTVVEQAIASGPTDEDKTMSFAVGFADALLALLRSPPVVVDPTLQFPPGVRGQSVR